MINLYLMTFKGFNILNFILENGYKELISCVISSRDTSIKEDYFEDIKKLCHLNKIIFFEKGKAHQIKESEFSMAISWRWLIHSSAPIIVFHDSLLPKYRGFAPLINMLKNGETEIGVSALYASDDYDCGDIITQSSQKITYPITINEAIIKITENYRQVVSYCLEKIKKDIILEGKEQDDSKSTYSLWLDESDYHINWNQNSKAILRLIDAVGFPYEGAFSKIDEKKYKIIKAIEIDDVFVENRTPGKVIFVKDGFPVIICSKGLIMITEMLDMITLTNALPLKKFRSILK